MLLRTKIGRLPLLTDGDLVRNKKSDNLGEPCAKQLDAVKTNLSYGFPMFSLADLLFKRGVYTALVRE